MTRALTQTASRASHNSISGKSVALLCPRPLGGGIKPWCCLTSDVCLSVA